jgi:hypothetical protein
MVLVTVATALGIFQGLFGVGLLPILGFDPFDSRDRSDRPEVAPDPNRKAPCSCQEVRPCREVPPRRPRTHHGHRRAEPAPDEPRRMSRMCLGRV